MTQRSAVNVIYDAQYVHKNSFIVLSLEIELIFTTLARKDFCCNVLTLFASSFELQRKLKEGQKCEHVT